MHKYAVELKRLVQCFPFSSVKNWSIYCFCCLFVFEKLVLPAERRGFFKKIKYDPFLALKTGPILLCNILGPVFNASLVQFLTCWLKPYFYSVFSKNAKSKETHKRKNTICEHTCANCSCQNVLFSAFFIFCNFQNFQRCF